MSRKKDNLWEQLRSDIADALLVTDTTYEQMAIASGLKRLSIYRWVRLKLRTPNPSATLAMRDWLVKQCKTDPRIPATISANYLQ